MYLFSSVIFLIFINLCIAEESCNIKNESGEDNLIDSKLKLKIEKGDTDFEKYGDLRQQSGMMRDKPRTTAYQRAFLENLSDFTGKVVMEIGAGTGILSGFAIQAGAKRVYAIEPSATANAAKVILSSTFGEKNVELVEPGKAKNTGAKKLVRIIKGKVEEIGRDEVPEDVDIIISETMGQMLYGEQRLDSYIRAKKFFGKNKVKMFPSKADLHFAPFDDEVLFEEQIVRAEFWKKTDYYGLNISGIYDFALYQVMTKTISGTIDPYSLMARTTKHRIDFEIAQESDLHEIKMPFEFTIMQSGRIHGLAFWFDAEFQGTDHTRWLTTSPWEPATHWFQTSCLVRTPLLAKKGDTLTGQVVLRVHDNLSHWYYVDIDMHLQTTITKPDGSFQKVTKHAQNHNIDMKGHDVRYFYRPAGGRQSESASELRMQEKSV